MLLTHLINAAVDWSLLFGGSCGPDGAPCPCNTPNMLLGIGGQLYCPGSTFTAIAAAYQTQGMWVQADVLEQIRYHGLGSLAALMYLASAIGGLIGVALGAPPKMYLWFFFGPAMFHWFVGTPYAAKGTEWRVADQDQNQREVWKLAEVGLLNSNWIEKAKAVYNDGAPESTVNVSWAFAYYDHFISGVIQNLTAWTGLYNMRASTQDLRSGVGPAPMKPIESTLLNKGSWLGDRWWLISNSKWGMIEDITNAKLANPKIRDTLATFMASECGDEFMHNMNSSAFLNAMYYKGRSAPGSVFQREQADQPLGQEEYEPLFRKMYGQRVPMPRSLRDLLKDSPTDLSSFVSSIGLSSTGNNAMRERMIGMDWIRCPAYLHLILEAFRWEAGQIYHQFMLSAPRGMDEEWLGYYLFYGWNVRKKLADPQYTPEQWPHLQANEIPEFVKNMILVHLIRNEMMIMPSSFTNRKMSFKQTEESSEGHLRFIATKNKFSELYQWALMVPHMQGILLYYLAIAFPFCAMMMVVPGFHKVTFTWMTFWLWAKLWDLGFAIVTSLERTVWAMIGNNSNLQGNLPQIAEMADWGKIGVVGCSGPTCQNTCTISDSACHFAQVTLTSGGGQTDLLSYASWASAVRIFDRALTLAANLDLDLSNSYYIYIMAGLYFSVPVVVGQLVLGAKSGSANLISNIIGAVGQEAGRQGAAGHQSDMIYRMKAAKAAVGQEAYAKGMRASGLMGQALNHGNDQILAGMDRAGLEAAAGGAKAVSQAANLTRANIGELTGAGLAGVGAVLGAAKAGSGLVGGHYDAKDKSLKEAAKQAERDAQRRGNGTGPDGSVMGRGNETGADGSGAATLGSLKQIGGSAAQGQAISWFEKGARAYGSDITGALLGSSNDAIGAAVKLGNYDAQRFAANSEFGASQIGNQSAIQGFGLGQQGSLYGASEQRVGAQAEFDARMAAWDAENAYSNQFASLSTALGFFAGGLEAGSKPVDRMGMAMSGDFGAGVQNQAKLVEPGGWMWGRVGSMRDQIESNWGQKAMADTYVSPAPTSVYYWTGRQAGTGLNSATGRMFGEPDTQVTGTIDNSGSDFGRSKNNSAVIVP